MKQLDLHKEIEKFFKTSANTADFVVGKSLLKNSDAKRYFYHLAEENWLTWLVKSGLLNVVEDKAKNPNELAYRMPELDYLTKVSTKNPEGVSKFIKTVKLTSNNFNPEVIDRFIWITGLLPAAQIKNLTSIIRDQQWFYLMRKFRKTGYELEQIVKKLAEAGESLALLELAEAMLQVKSKDEISEKENSLYSVDPFYISDLDASGVYEALATIDEMHKERALALITKIFSQVTELASTDESKVFEYNDPFSLYDVDFYELKIENNRSISYRQDVKNLAATLKILIDRNLTEKCGTGQAKMVYDKYIAGIPSSRTVWRLKLFALTRCPKDFKLDLRKALFKLFEVNNYYEIAGGAEYKQTLKISFRVLSEPDQRMYVSEVVRYFSEKASKNPEETWHKHTGLQIISSIPAELLTEEEKKQCEAAFGGKYIVDFKPEPTITNSRSGWVRHREPQPLAAFTIEQIIEKLKTDWMPEKLELEFKDDDFLDRRGPEGLGDALKGDVEKRLNEYLVQIIGFFDEAIHPHYLYSVLRGFEDKLRAGHVFEFSQINQLLELFSRIREKGGQEPFHKTEKQRDDRDWLVDWITVHIVIVDILLYILQSDSVKKKVQEDPSYRNEIKDLISYLFTIKDSPSKEDEKPDCGELHHIAINSVRGRAFETFVVFTEIEGKTLAEDVKELYLKVLEDDSLAVRFTIGRYLASFYFRDHEFIMKHLEKIFPKDDVKSFDIYLATWEGYLSNTLYDKLFNDLHSYYEHAIGLNAKHFTQRKYVKDLDEMLATHLALAFVYFNLKMEGPLLEQFWSTPNTVRHHEFISFVGRGYINRDSEKTNDKVDKEKLLNFWDWANKQDWVDPAVLEGFGFWINPDEEVLQDREVIVRIVKTLEKSGGAIEWDHGLMKRLTIFAKINPEKTLEIIRYFLLDSNGNINSNRHVPMFAVENEVKEALKIIYGTDNPDLKKGVFELIDQLILKGSSMFWGLKDVIK